MSVHSKRARIPVVVGVVVLVDVPVDVRDVVLVVEGVEEIEVVGLDVGVVV